MNKTAIKNFSIWARNKLIADVSYRAGLMGITANGIDKPLPQSTATAEFYHIGTKEPYQISGEAISQRRRLVEVMERKARETDYATAYHYVLEEVAYTWFNRLIAIRFMEVNDYLPSHIRMLSSETGKMEPDLVTTPFDAELDFTGDEKDAILRMQRDNDVDGLFHLLFIKQCNALNAILPGLFEKTNDFTELLLNLSVIDREGVVYRLVHDIEEKDFNIEQEDGVEIIGWLYQYWNTEPKAAVFGRPSGAKIKKEEIPAATQLFTPHWIVRYMVENSLGRLWVEGHPNDALKSKWTYYLDEAEQEPDVQVKLAEIRKGYAALTPEDIRCIDPCCGSGHILAYLFDVLVQIYESRGYAARDAAQSIVRYNLHGLDIDKRAAQLAYFSVMMKARQYDRRFFSRNLQPMVYSTAGDEDGENFGSLVRVDDPGARPEEPETLYEREDYERRLNAWSYRYLLAQKYHVVCTNPPYMAVSNASGKVQEYVKKNFPDSKADLFAVFIERCGQMAKQNGYQVMITQHAWMFLSSFEKLRAKLQAVDTVNMAHLGARAFEEVGGEVVQTTSFVMRRSHAKGYKGTYCRLIEPNTQQGKENMFIAGGNRYIAQQDNFSKIPGSPVAYWAGKRLISAFENETWGVVSPTSKGIITGDNSRFLRLWFEVSTSEICFDADDFQGSVVSGLKWFPCNKGGEYRKWFGNNSFIINWQDNGKEIMQRGQIKTRNCQDYRDEWKFKPSITWTDISSAAPSFRYSKNALSESAGMSTFPNSNILYLLGLINTVVVTEILKITSPTIHFTAGAVAAIPLIYKNSDKVNSIVEENIFLSRADWDSFETSWDFQRHPLVEYRHSVSKAEIDPDWSNMSYFLKDAYEAWEYQCQLRFDTLKANEEELNRIFIHIYGLQDELTPEVEDKDVTVRKADLGRDVRSLLSYAVGCMFGRYSIYKDGLAYAGGVWNMNDFGYYVSQYFDDGTFPKQMYSSRWFMPDEDNIVPITDEEYLEDDIVSLLCKWLKTVYGPNTLEENLDFIAEALGNKGATSREVIRNYFLKDFFADHCKIYQKRPIYWLFDSGKQNGFKALIYLHRYTPDTVGNMRVDYLHRLQRIYESEIDRMQDMIDHSKSPREAANAAKRKEKLQKQLKECRDYDGKIGHLALSRIELDLDDGVKVNYRKVQTAADGKLYEVLADSGNIMGKK